MRYSVCAAAALCLSASALPAQSIAQQVAAIHDGHIELTYAARAGTCGDGRNFLEDGYGGQEWSDGNYRSSRRGEPAGECERGPVRVLATVDEGRVIRMRSFVGPLPSASPDTRRVALSTHDAVAFLSDLAQHGDGRVANEALDAIALADSTTPWPLFMRLSGDESLGKGVRRQAAFWLSRGVSAKLGLVGADEGSSDDDVRKQAVFALSQQPVDVAVPRLLEVARSGGERGVRASAVFWLGQTGDPRAVRWFGEVLGVR